MFYYFFEGVLLIFSTSFALRTFLPLPPNKTPFALAAKLFLAVIYGD